MNYTIGLKTDTGQQRSHNEDAGEILDLPGVDVAFVVCDGMGGLRSGEVASQETVRIVRETLHEFFASGVPDPYKALGEAFRRANDHVNALNRAEKLAESGNSRETPTRREEGVSQAVMGTTCVAGIVMEDILYLAHAGDSRAYRWRRGHLAPLTEDHSFVAERVKAGDMTEAQARVSKFRNMITQAIGIAETVEPTFLREPMEPGDVIMACSDGLTTMMEDPEIVAVMNAPAFLKAAPERAAGVLVDAANKKGGHDNITVLLVRVESEGREKQPIVLDMDAPKPVKQTSPLLWMLIGVLLLAAVIALILFVPSMREQVLSLLNTKDTPTIKSATPGSSTRRTKRDFNTLSYDPPVRFADYLARGDVLTYAPGVGLYFVAETSGKVALLSKEGRALRSVEALEIMDSRLDTIPSTRVFVTSDPQGNVYLSYTKRKVVEKKGADGTLLATIKGFLRPEAIAVDDDGNIYVVDYNEIKISRARLPGEKPAPSAFVTPSPTPTPK
jgi:PPM family protein phosphatase